MEILLLIRQFVDSLQENMSHSYSYTHSTYKFIIYQNADKGLV